MTGISFLLMDLNQVHTFSSKLFQFTFDFSQILLQTPHGVPFEAEALQLFHQGFSEFLGSPNLKLPFLYDPKKTFLLSIQKIKIVMDEFFKDSLVLEYSDLASSYQAVRPSYILMIQQYQSTSSSIAYRINFVIFLFLFLLLGLSTLIIYFVFYPLLKDVQNLNRNRKSWIFFKEFQYFKSKNRSVKE